MWNVSLQRLIRGLALLATALLLLAAVAWALADAAHRVQPATVKILYTTLQLRSEFWTWSNWATLSGVLFLASILGIPSGIQFLFAFPFIPPLKVWSFIVLSQTLATWVILKFYSRWPLPSSAEELREAAVKAGEPQHLAWFLRILLGLPNRSIDLVIAARLDDAHRPGRLTLWSLPGHSLRAALTGGWIYFISLAMMNFRPFPEYDLVWIALMTLVVSFFWLLPWIPEVIPGGTSVQQLVTLCSGANSPTGHPPRLPGSITPARQAQGATPAGKPTSSASGR